ncbi:DUF262 domain-containing protein [Amycolatopsis albispora]|uniref:GmrSD restriction endonucleases N-terminal domain-containing protein n=1 Tax=Amycolatopsis albispora TaxID=1804986 RepID=A0A344LCA2_9PSEU|nr:DUF262 domain-containing protein [Amycolatopsis albispora]AXB45676.1 hypothetical protein A4R43_26930 [Amycolatopsis albispora]
MRWKGVTVANIPRLVTYSLQKLVDLALHGEIRIPAFQRPFVWHASHVIDFFGSLLRGYPVGMLLFAERPAEADTLAFGPVVVDAPARERALWIIDGLQRTTALVGTLGPATDTGDPRFDIGVDLDTGQVSGATADASAAWVPLRTLFGQDQRAVWRRENAHWLTDGHHRALDQYASRLVDTVLPGNIFTGDETELVEVFSRLNTGGRRLTDEEVAHAGRSTSGNPFDRAGFGRVPAARLSAVHQAVQAVASAGGPSPQQVLFQVATTLRRDVHIPHLRLLPHNSMLLVLVAFVARFGPPQGRTADLVRRWVWRTAILEPGPYPEAQLSRLAAAESPEAAVLSLLEAAPTQVGDWSPDLDHHTEWRASDRLNALGLWSAGPRHLDENHAPLSAAEIFDSGEPLPEAAPIDGWPGLLLHPPLGRLDFVRQDVDTLASHLIDTAARKFLLSGDQESFGAHRADLLAQAVRTVLDRNAEWGARDSFSARNLLGRAARDA